MVQNIRPKKNNVLEISPKSALKLCTHSSSNGFFEYLIFRTNIQMFNDTAIELPFIITKSALPIPYTVHRKRLIIKIIRNE